MDLFLVCNSHLDPVWLWRWNEGVAESLSTFRSAADLLDEYPALIFNHNESLLYEWVEAYEPELFRRIQKHVENGRWNIMGGWFLQPDVNMPSGESIVRQILKGFLYFKEKFHTFSKTAVNFDSFGHSRGLVQVLKQFGYEQYIVCRPAQEIYPFAQPDFLWQGYDGSEIIVHRSDENYNSVFGKAGEEILQWQSNHDGGLFLWGVGNHGGGPSRKDLEDISKLIRQGEGIRHSRPEDYFSAIDKRKLPVVAAGLNPVARGCYTSQIRVKQKHRQLENELLMAERMAVHAKAAGLAAYEKELLAQAWHDLLFAQFHDALPGSAIQPVEEDTLQLLSHGLEITDRLCTKYFFALSAGQEKGIADSVPLLVYNPHPFSVTTPIECAFVLPKQNWEVEFSVPVVYQNGKRLRCQGTKEDGNFNMDWCKKAVFEATLEAFAMNRFDVLFEKAAARPVPRVSGTDGRITVSTPRSQVVINTKTGRMDAYVVEGVSMLKAGAMAVGVFEDGFNSWGGKQLDQGTEMLACFRPMTSRQATEFAGVKGGEIPAVRMIEDGELHAVVEALMVCGESKLVMRYYIDKESPTVSLRLTVFNTQKEKILKLIVPAEISDTEYYGQTMFGREKLSVRQGEAVSHCWTAIANDIHAITIINDGVYGSDFKNGEARISLLRSAGYGAATFVLGEPYHEPMYQPRMEQGQRCYSFVIAAGDAEKRLQEVDREAAVWNQKPFALPYCPPGEGEKPAPLLEIGPSNVVLSACKQSEQGDSVTVRIYEAQGKSCEYSLQSKAFRTQKEGRLNPFEIKTFRIIPGKVEETDIFEEQVL